ncbi:MAG: cardiolipin synthase [Porphyromonas sp.]|nr:cardiolipin synthase [Porphyromonas sp.]
MIGWKLVLSIIFIIIAIEIIIVILLENRNPHKALGWIVVLVFLPVVGVIIYLLFGRKNWKLNIINKHASDRFNFSDTPHELSEDYPLPLQNDFAKYRRLHYMVEDETSAQLLKADEVAIFTNGMDKMDALLEDVRNAKEFIHIEYYRFLDDRTGQALASALIEKAREGVEVRLLCDFVGSFSTRNSFFRNMVRNGVEVTKFLKVVLPSFKSDLNYRNHRKLVVIDKNIGYLGGMNIADHYTVGNSKGIWHDTHFRITGMAVNGLESAFMSDWRFSRKIALSHRYFLNSKTAPLPPCPNLSEGYEKAVKVKDVHLQTFTSGPTGLFRTLLQAWSRSIYEAVHHIYIETPYFLPNDSLNKALIGAALSGVEVVIAVPWESDSTAVRFASQSFYAELINAGVKIYRFNGPFNHSKLMTIDGYLSFIGSANMDFRSLEYNFELTSIVYDERFAQGVEQRILTDIESHCQLIEKERWDRRSIMLKLKQSFFRLFSPLM